ncbi:DUF732 domain-containing protein [Knoellia sp. CPCC 206453]|uniref:DUF732 domain-containing protein n=1 Tax=Knoellia pratensis TaxID=3404796 RepID=UPI00361964FE
MLTFRKPATLLIGAAMALALTACGSESSDGDAGSTPSTTTSPSGPATSTGTTPEPGNSGIVPDATWAGIFKRAVPPLASKSDKEVATAARKVCSDFEAAPTKETAKTILQGAQSGLGLDATQAQIFATGAITHFCTGQSGAWTTAAIG